MHLNIRLNKTFFCSCWCKDVSSYHHGVLAGLVAVRRAFGYKNQQLFNGFFFNFRSDGGVADAHLFITVLRLCLGTKLLSDSSYAKKKKEKKRKLWHVGKVSSAATAQTHVFFFHSVTRSLFLYSILKCTPNQLL